MAERKLPSKSKTSSTTSRSTASRAKTPAPTQQATYGGAPTQADIERRAYEIFLERNGGPGDSMSDWLQAERELRSGNAGSKPAAKRKVTV